MEVTAFIKWGEVAMAMDALKLSGCETLDDLKLTGIRETLRLYKQELIFWAF
jgi:hypothetical protein